jgi:hypothetical protein
MNGSVGTSTSLATIRNPAERKSLSISARPGNDEGSAWHVSMK